MTGCYRKQWIIPLVALCVMAQSQLPVSAQIQIPPPLPQPASPPTLWSFLGIPQGVRKVRGALTNRRGNVPRLEPKVPVRALNDPINLLSENKAIKKAAEVKIQEDLKPQKIKAIKYLTSIACGCYDAGEQEVSQALEAATKDCTEDVRLVTVQHIEEAAHGKCCSNCGQVCCCNEIILKRLAEMAYGRDDTGCYKEPSTRVREAAVSALVACCPGNEPPVIIDEEPTMMEEETATTTEEETSGNSEETSPSEETSGPEDNEEAPALEPTSFTPGVTDLLPPTIPDFSTFADPLPPTSAPVPAHAAEQPRPGQRPQTPPTVADLKVAESTVAASDFYARWSGDSVTANPFNRPLPKEAKIPQAQPRQADLVGTVMHADHASGMAHVHLAGTQNVEVGTRLTLVNAKGESAECEVVHAFKSTINVRANGKNRHALAPGAKVQRLVRPTIIRVSHLAE